MLNKLKLLAPKISIFILLLGFILIAVIAANRFDNFETKLAQLEQRISSIETGSVSIKNPPPGDEEPILYLPLYELNGDEFLSKDAYMHPTQVIGAMLTSQGRSFDGTYDFIEVLDHPVLSLQANFTINAWVKLDDVLDYRTIVAKEATGSGNYDPYNFRVEKDSGFLFGRIANGKRSESIIGKTNISDNHWHFVSFVADTAILYLYTDGQRDAQPVPKTLAQLSNAENLRIGDWEGYTDAFWKGLIGEVAIYNRALKPFEIKNIYESNKERYQ